METSISDIKGATKIPITTAGNITASGSYILANDIDGQISILASNVSLDLNGHTITASTIGNDNALVIYGVNDIRIYNGTVIQAQTGNNRNCLKIDDAPTGNVSRIVISNVNCFLSNPSATTSQRGIFIQGNNSPSIATDILIKNCLLHSSGAGYGIFIDGPTSASRIKIEKCVVGCFNAGIDLNRCSDCIIQNCFIYKCQSFGIRFTNATLRSLILHNTLRECGETGIQGTGIPASGILIYGNDVQGCTNTSTSSRPYHYESANYVYGNFAKNNAGMTTAADNYSPQIKLNMAGTITDVTGKWANIALS
ncbi:right-handed parallel beta-helix repeat-containing protein [Candidatus Dependentiae bacterium]|nr:right-handed parallel beta-helix repeat-containing protein [Candidatus Dependentiae bacterium]